MVAAKKLKPVEMIGDLEPMLTRLKLTAIRDQLETLLDQAARAEMNLREALTMLCTAEVARKDERRIQMGLSIAKFPFVRTLEGFEYDAQPSVDPKQIRDLATSRWVANGDSVLLLGPPGVGKTHLAVALGREAIVRGYSTLFVPATGLVTQLARAHAEGRLEDKLLLASREKSPLAGDVSRASLARGGRNHPAGLRPCPGCVDGFSSSPGEREFPQQRANLRGHGEMSRAPAARHGREGPLGGDFGRGDFCRLRG